MEFRRPDILEADLNPLFGAHRVAEEELSHRLEVTERMLHRICEYSRTLWNQLDETRHYLLSEVAGGEDGRAHTLLPDDQAWQSWAELFGSVSSTLAGTSGDSGFGRSEAALIARSHGAEIRPTGR